MSQMKCFLTELGQLYQEDCISWLKTRPSGEADLFFAAPPYNITIDTTKYRRVRKSGE